MKQIEAIYDYMCVSTFYIPVHYRQTVFILKHQRVEEAIHNISHFAIEHLDGPWACRSYYDGNAMKIVVGFEDDNDEFMFKMIFDLDQL